MSTKNLNAGQVPIKVIVRAEDLSSYRGPRVMTFPFLLDRQQLAISAWLISAGLDKAPERMGPRARVSAGTGPRYRCGTELEPEARRARERVPACRAFLAAKSFMRLPV